MGGKSNKAFADLLGTQVIIRTLQTVSDCPCIKTIFVVTRMEEIPAMQALITAQLPENHIVLISGGATRQDSVFCGLNTLAESLEQSGDRAFDPLVAIHDGARCLVTQEVICRTLRHALVCGPCAAAVPVKDTIKVANADGRVLSTLDRSGLFAMQTPQVARLSLLISAFTKAKTSGFAATDDLSVLEAAGIAVDLVPGDERNIKLTTPFDLMIARAILSAKQTGKNE
jgi:2-C-methyl-D-erythritol 4-phosphate cytidylyltransferase